MNIKELKSYINKLPDDTNICILLPNGLTEADIDITRSEYNSEFNCLVIYFDV